MSKKIEKLEDMTINGRESDIEVMRFAIRNMKKINEIIDYLNQDQKQTESGWFCSKCGEYVPDKQVFYPNQPEKQEEWREENIKELFAEWGLWSLVEDVSDDGDGNLQLTHRGRMFVEELKSIR